MAPRPALISTCCLLLRGNPSRQRLDRYRNRRIADLVAHAYRHVPYYRDAFDAHGVHPDDVRGVEDLARLPILTRNSLQDEAKRLVSDTVDPATLGHKATSGSTGRPIGVSRTPRESHLLNALRLRGDMTLGRRVWMRHAAIELSRSRPHGPRSWWLRLAAACGLLRRRTIDSLQEPEQIFEQLRAERIHSLAGFPGTLARVADAAGPGGLVDLGIRMITTGGEVSTPQTRARIADAFGAPVYETYNCIELYNLAWQCRDTSLLHVNDKAVVLEILKDGRAVPDGEAGEVVITGLHSYAMPLIRYAIGDVATRGPMTCPCGAPWGTVRSVQGRELDLLSLPDGRLIHPWHLTTPMNAANPWIGRYRLTQDRLDHFTLEIVPLETPSPEQLDALRQFYRETAGIMLAVELVEEIEPEASGKYRVVRSLLQRAAV